MIKLIYCVRRLPSLSLEEFQAHWLEHHPQLGRGRKPMRRYLQYHTLANDPTRQTMAQARVGAIEPYDGVGVAWWDNLEAMQAAMEKSSDLAEAVADQKFFIDQSHSVACLTQEHVIVEPEGSVPYVFIECLRRRSGLDRAAFQKAWLEHAEIGRRAHVQGLMMGYIQNHTLLEGDMSGIGTLGTNPETWDGIVTAYFDSVAKFKAFVASPLVAEEAFENSRKFIDHSQSAYMLTRRHVIKDIAR